MKEENESASNLDVIYGHKGEVNEISPPFVFQGGSQETCPA